MLRRLNIGNKLALVIMTFSILVTVFLSASFYLQFERALRERIFLQLSSVKQLKKVKIETEIHDRLELFQDLIISSGSNYSGFLEFSASDKVPDHLAGYMIDQHLLTEDSTLLHDVTTQQPDKGITIVFMRKQNDTIWAALARFEEIQSILLERTGLGETGESYLVNEQEVLITRSRFKTADWEYVKVSTRGVILAFEGQPGTDIFLDYRGIRVLGAFEKIEMNGLKWVLLSEINYNEGMAPLGELRANILLTFIVVVFFILIVSFYLSKMVVLPIVNMEKQLMQLSKGVLHERKEIPARVDEIGRMFVALDRLVSALEKTVDFAGEIGSGNFDASYQPLSKEDKLGTALLQMQQQLRDYKENEFRLLRENQRSMVDGEENERSRFSKELHDGLGPMLTTLRINIQATDLNDDTRKKLLNQLDDTIREVRRISNNLMPSVLEDFGAGEAIGNLVKQVSEKSELSIRYKNDMRSEPIVPDPVHITLYRITQEAINNALKHADCTEMKISLTQFDNYVGLFFSDNGHGFDPGNPQAGNGLRNMRERVKLANGSMEIQSGKKGTIIEIEIPV